MEHGRWIASRLFKFTRIGWVCVLGTKYRTSKTQLLQVLHRMELLLYELLQKEFSGNVKFWIVMLLFGEFRSLLLVIFWLWPMVTTMLHCGKKQSIENGGRRQHQSAKALLYILCFSSSYPIVEFLFFFFYPVIMHVLNSPTPLLSENDSDSVYH